MLPAFVEKNPSGYYEPILKAYVFQEPSKKLEVPRPSPTLWQAFWAYLACVVA